MSGGWWRNGSRSDERLTRENHVANETGVHSAKRANRADKEPDYVEVRASIVAEKRGNARRAKGRRKIEQIRPAGRNRPPLVIGLSGERSVQGGELCPGKGVQSKTFQPTLTCCWQAAIKGRQIPMQSKRGVAEPRSSTRGWPRYVLACQSHRRPYRLESRMRENRLSGLMRGGKQTVIGLVPLNPSLPAYSTRQPAAATIQDAAFCTPASLSSKDSGTPVHSAQLVSPWVS